MPGRRWPPAEPPRHFGAASLFSILLHAAAVAGLLFGLDRTPPPEPAPDRGVEIVWDQDATEAVSTPETTEPPGAPPSVEAPESPEPAEPPPPPPPVAAAPPPPAPPPPPSLAQVPPPPTPPLDVAPVELPAPNLAVAPPPPAPPEEIQEAAAPPQPPAPPMEPPQEVQQAAAPPTPPAPEPPPPEPTRQQAQPRLRTPPRPPARPAAPRAAEAPNPGAPQTVAGIGQALGAVVPPAPDSRFQNAAPSYPEAARLRGEQGSVGLSLSIGVDGRVVSVEVARSSGSPMLDAAARRAVTEWRFRPAQRDGVPIAGTIRTSVHFRLQ